MGGRYQTINDSSNKHLIATPEDYALIFESHKAGQKVYEDLIARFGRVPSNSEGIDRVLDQFEFSGRRKVIEFITLRINQANGAISDEDIEISVDG